MCESSAAQNLDGQHVSNPFSTRYVRPGAMGFRFGPGPKFEQLVDRLRDTGYWGQIIGPHGTGKSTLVATLVERVHQYGIRAVHFELHDGQRHMPTAWQKTAWNAFEQGRSTMVIVDGFEQLNRFCCWRVKHICRAKNWGLLVTAHKAVGLPTLYRTSTSAALAQSLTETLLSGYETTITPDQIQKAFQHHDGNLRNVFFALFDHYERNRD